jgi:hypothetical protein
MQQVTVKMFDRTFLVFFDERGTPLSIKSRKVYAEGRPFEALYNATYWHHSAGIGGPRTRPYRIIAVARQKAHIPNAETIMVLEESRHLG